MDYRVAVVMLGLSACGLDQVPPAETACSDAEARLGKRVCVHRIDSDAVWSSIAFDAAAVDQVRSTTYLIPARDDARVPTAFVDANAFETPEESLHYKFLTESFEDLAALEYMEYVDLVRDPAQREWFGGALTEYIIGGQASAIGFTVYDPAEDAASTVDCETFVALHTALDERIGFGEVFATPATDLQREVLRTCEVASYDPSEALDYEAYTVAKGCGTLRRFTNVELTAAQVSGTLSFQDVVVLDEAPLDLEPIVSGIVTGTRQGELSHLNVRSANRGTPNCYVADAHALLASSEGQLVELECGVAGATLRPITVAEAEACWERLRPEPVDVVPLDLSWAELVPLLEVPTETADARRLAVGRFGSKGANLATLYQRIDPELQLDGFVVPVHYYDAFVNTATWARPGGTVSVAEAIDAMLADESFRADGKFRRSELLALQDAMRAATCDPALLDAIALQIVAMFGDDTTMVRFRSSSNAEDALHFNGAGLYDSTSGCVADQTDGDANGPSHCDPDEPKERELCRALTKVWASLWNPKAYEERQWYGIDHRQTAMGILVNTRSKGELANIVAFTGNPLLAGDKRLLINAQLGELAVVAAQPGVYPEKDLLTVVDGVVTEIERARGSTELPDGQWVLDDTRLRELGAALTEIEAVYPIDAELSPVDDVLLDTEWKLRADGRLAIKQVRPFLD